MKEAQPNKIKAPSKEPQLRVGIVLEEDDKEILKFSINSSYTLINDKLNLDLENKEYEFKINSNSIECILEDKVIALGNLFKLETKSTKITPKSGIKFNNIVAGRGFHWKKEINQYISGNFEIHQINQKLVLINIINFEDYLACVISSEMNAECPAEFSKAQAIAARTWALVFLSNKHPDKNYDICNDDDCQRYQGTTFLKEQALNSVKSCKGEILVNSEDSLIPTYYSKSCGGHSDSAQSIFGFNISELQAVPDNNKESLDSLDLSKESDFKKFLDLDNNFFCSSSTVKEESLSKYIGAVDQEAKYFRWEYNISTPDLCENLKNKYSIDIISIIELKPGIRGRSGRYLNFKISYLNSQNKLGELVLEDQYEIRKAFHQSFLFSSAFIFKIKNNQVVFKGAGWGHGVGLCQIGALGMALNNKTYKEILSHYYPKSILKKSY